MSDKSVQKKKHILDTARKVFQEKGYKQVTMKDIVDACDQPWRFISLFFKHSRDF